MLDHDVIEERLEFLKGKYGKVTPDIVVEDARDTESPLHDQFEWDLEKAAMRTWRETARKLIRTVEVRREIKSQIICVPRYVRDPDSDSEEQGYVDTIELRSQHDRAVRVIQREIGCLAAVVDRVRALAIGLDLEDEVEVLFQAVVQLKEKSLV